MPKKTHTGDVLVPNCIAALPETNATDSGAHNSGTLLSTDGHHRLIEGISETVRSAAIGDSAPITEENLSKPERLALLREAQEVVEEDSDVNDVFMYARSDRPLTRKDLVDDFPSKKALVITQAQMEQIEAGLGDGCFFSYINDSGKRVYVNAEDMTEPLVLFLEDLGE